MPDSTAVGSKRQRLDPIDPTAVPPVTSDDAFIQDQDAQESGGDDDEDEDKPKTDKKAGRRKIKIEFIQDKSRRHITFSKRKAGIMKKAYELSTLTGTQVLLLVVSETGLVYTFTTAKLQPLVTQPEGKNLIQACLNAPHGQLPSSMPVGTPLGRSSGPMGGAPPHSPAQPAPPPNVPGGLSIGGKDDDANDEGEGAPASANENADASNDRSRKRRRASSTTSAPNTRSSAQAATQSSGHPPPPPPPPPSNQTSPVTSAANSQPPPPSAPQGAANQATSPHARQPMPLPGALAIPGTAQGQQMAPQSPSYAGYPSAGDPNAGMYGGYGAQPQAGPQGNPYGGYAPPVAPGHEQAQTGMAWGPQPGVQQGNHYQRR